MAPKYDPDVGCVIPEKGDWPVDPQQDQPIEEHRIWIDGCFDFFHYGHTGVMLQCRRQGGDELLVGLHSDKAIAENKGPTVMNLDERVAAVEACRFSTKVVPHSPYVTSIPWIDHYGCKYVGHGDDITSDISGNDAYRFAKKAGRMKIVPRTPGISTTDLVGRMLLCTKSHFIKSLTDVLDGNEGRGSEEERKRRGIDVRQRMHDYACAENGRDKWVDIYSFKPKHRPKERRRSSVLSTVSSRSSNDSSQSRAHDSGKGTFESLVSGLPPRPGQRIVYIDGGFDLFSPGHIAFLQQIADIETKIGKAEGWFEPEAVEQRVAASGADYGPAYVVAGIHDDEVINHYKGINYPIENLYERSLCLIQCRYIHSVIFSAPHTPSRLFLANLPSGMPTVVYHGPTSYMLSSCPDDPYADAKAMGIFVQTEKHRFQDVNSAQIVQRILDKRAAYEERQVRKGEKGVGEGRLRREEMEAEQREREKKFKEVERQFGA